MKRLAVVICALVVVFTAVTACSAKNGLNGESEDSYIKTISSLEGQLNELKQNMYISDSEKQERIDALMNELKALGGSDTQDTQITVDSTESVSGYKYTLIDGGAEITGYIGDDVHLVIPASVDGHRVLSVANSAFEDTDLVSVILSDGIENVGWFAFNGCVKLDSITVPSSVKQIGYYAFGHTGSSVTVYCHSDSFALSYAQSFGLEYVII